MKTCVFIALFAFLNAFQCIVFDWETSMASILNDIGSKSDVFDLTNNLDDLATYDFVFFGTGPGGSTCAAGILREQPNARILMLEAGTYDLSPDLDEFKNGPYWTDSVYDWKDPVASADTGLNRDVILTSGYALGGGSTVNYMFWIRGDPNDFNSWAKITGDNSWNYEKVLPYFKKLETYSENNSPYRGDSGDVFVTTNFSDNSFTDDFKEAVRKGKTDKLKKNKDYNGKDIFGVSTDQFNCKPTDDGKGKRQDAFSTQLEKHLGKTNFHVLTSAYGDKVVLTDGANKAVKYAIFKRGNRYYKVRATKDVVVSGGSLRSPLVLLRSGIGSCAELTARGFPCLVNLPGVGKQLGYHFISGIISPFTQIPSENVFFTITTDTINITGTDLAKNIYLPFYMKDRPIADPSLLFTAYIQTHMRSRGVVSLNSLNATDRPHVQLNGFNDPQDLADHIEGMRKYLEMAASLKDEGLLAAVSIAPSPTATDAELAVYIKQTTTINHFVSTCKMGAESDTMAVVDTTLKVRGVQGLRVVDASIMPHVTSGNTNSPTMMVGAKGADEILKQYYGK